LKQHRSTKPYEDQKRSERRKERKKRLEKVARREGEMVLAGRYTNVRGKGKVFKEIREGL